MRLVTAKFQPLLAQRKLKPGCRATAFTVLLTFILIGCSNTANKNAASSELPDSKTTSANDFLIVDCLLPGQVKKLGSKFTFLSPRRPIKTSGADCAIRGGEYVAYDRADYSTALKIWLPLAQEGNPEAQTYVGEIYENGLGLLPDYQVAAHWYKQAVDQGFSRAQINLGHLYEMGLGVESDKQQALNLYRLASGISSDKLLFASTLTATHVPLKTHKAVETELAQQQQQSKELQQKLRRVDQALQTQTSVLLAAEQQLETTENKLEQLTSAQPNNGQQGAASVKETELAAEIATLEAERQQLEQQLSELGQQNQELEQKQQTLQQQLASTENVRAEQQTLIEQTQQQLLASKQRLDQSEQDLGALKQQLSQQQASEAANEPKIAAMQREIEEKNTRLQQERDKYAALESENSAQQQKLQQTVDELAAQKKQMASLSTKDQLNTASLKTALTAGEQQLADTSRQLLLSKAALQMEQSKREQALSEQSEQHRLEMAEQEKELAQLSAQFEQQVAQVNRQKHEIAKLQKEANLYSAEIAPAAAAPVLLASNDAPRIEIIEPPVILTRSQATVRLRALDEQRQVIGKVSAPAGIMSLSVNGVDTTLADNNLFRTAVPIKGDPTPVDVVVIDSKGRRAAIAFSFVNPAAGTQSAQTAGRNPSKPISTAGKSGVATGNYHALIIGNNDYRHLSTLATAVNDAQETDRVLREKYNFNTTLLLNADRYTILSALNDLRSSLKESDNLLIYYAGHGRLDEDSERGYWLPVDADTDNDVNWISNRAISEILDKLAAKHVLVVADSCYSGTLTQTPLARVETDVADDVRAEWIKIMADTRARITLTSGGVEPVLDGGGGSHSVFAKAFLDALRSNDRILEGYSLYYQVLDNMQASAANVAQSQVPQYAPIHMAGHESGEFFFNPS
ncbi:MAG: caspase family protein [Pseudomonadales bacterium]